MGCVEEGIPGFKQREKRSQWVDACGAFLNSTRDIQLYKCNFDVTGSLCKCFGVVQNSLPLGVLVLG